MNATQTPNEQRFYKQSIQGDTVLSAAWTLELAGNPSAPPVTGALGIPQIGQDYSMVLVSHLVDGLDYDLNVLITTVTGQVVEGCAYIQCRECT